MTALLPTAWSPNKITLALKAVGNLELSDGANIESIFSFSKKFEQIHNLSVILQKVNKLTT
jgi:hypothetical protein